MNKWGRWYLPLCIFTIINYLVWRKSVQVNSKPWSSVTWIWWYIILRSWEAPSHLMWQHIQIGIEVRTSHNSMLHAQTTSECKQDPLVEKMTTVSRIPPVVLTARFAASSPTTRTLASWWSTTTSLAGNSGQEVWLSPPLCLQHHHLLHEAVSVRNGEENSGWNSIIPPDVQTDGEVLQDQGLQLGEDGLEDFLLEFFFFWTDCGYFSIFWIYE